MTETRDISQDLVEQVKQAFDSKTAIRISAGNSKLFYGNAVSGDKLDIRGARRHYRLPPKRAGDYRSCR